MKNRYTHVAYGEREIIRLMLAAKHSPAQIAKFLGKHRSTVCREIKRNANGGGLYYERHAHTIMLKRRLAGKAPHRRIDRDYILQAYVEDLLKKSFSPEQIQGYMRRSAYAQSLCHKTIYSWIHRRWQSRKAYLRFKGRPRVPYGLKKRLWQPHRRHISDRPAIVEKRSRVGDWEIDLVHGNKDDSRHSLLTLNERKTGFCIIRKLTSLSPLIVAHVITHALKDLPVHTITSDNGFEFGQHKTIEKKVGCKMYFTDVNSPQQRGSNENLNGLIREFFPKGVSMAHVRQEDATAVAVILNRRPRKRLNFDCPRNAFAEETGASARF
jgi:transposase, IS30 family